VRRLFDRVFLGSDEMYAKAVSDLNEAIAKFGADHPMQFPDTAYNCAIILEYTGISVKTLGDLKKALDGPIKDMMTRNLRTHDVFTNGFATAMAAEVIEACKYVDNPNPYNGEYHGHMTDAEVRELGVPLVTQDIPGFVVLIGPAPSDEEARDTIKSYQNRGIFVFLIGGIIDQAKRMGISMGFKVRIVEVGPDIWSVSHVVSLVMRAAMIFGAIQPLDYWGMNTYTLERIFAFVNAYAPVNDITVACGGAAIGLGFPVITNDKEDIQTVPKSLIVQPDTKAFIDTSLEARNIKIKVTKMDIPIAFNSAFEGEIIRKADMRLEIDGSRTDSFELVKMRDVREIEDHKITLIGPDFDAFEPGKKIPAAIIAEVGGANMQSDFEPVIERKFHNWINCLEGVMHTGQRNLIRIRISHAAFEAGLRAKHFGEMLYAKIKSDYDTVVDKCQITIITDPEECTRQKNELAMPVYDGRDVRLANLTDEAVDVFYTCTLCQSFSPSHVCIVTPERLGLCGAVSWLDAKATNQLNPNGPCQIVKKDDVIDENIGIWPDVNRAVSEYSHGALESVTLYSIIQDPMTSCGCFECICGLEPASNGVIIVNREYAGSTPIGMSFAELASMTGGGEQTPGFMGHGRHFIASKKFMRAEGGIARIVWMPKMLKDAVAEKLNKTAKELYGIDNYTDMICDETIAPTVDEIDKMLEFLTEKGHPVLAMEPMI
jgi:acetyl-CoA synthase